MIDLYSTVTKNYQGIPNMSYDTNGENIDTIDQVLIPPMTFDAACKYLNNYFGLHYGATSIYCNYDGTLYIRNVSDQVKNSKVNITFTQLVSSQTTDSNEAVMKKSLSGKDFFIYTNINSTNNGNVKLAYYGKIVRYMTKPKNDLYGMLEFDLQEISNNYGLSDSNGLYYDSGMDRIKYEVDQTGFSDSPAFAISKIARQISNTSTMDFRIERNIMMKELFQVGRAAKLNIASEVSDLSGVYVLSSSVIDLKRSQAGYIPTAEIRIIKTNKT